MSYAPQGDPILICTQRYPDIVRWIKVCLVTLSAGVMAVLVFGSISVGGPFWLILGIVGSLLILLIMMIWFQALRWRPGEYRFYEDGLLLQDKTGALRKGFYYTEIGSYQITKITSGLYQLLFSIVGVILGIGTGNNILQGAAVNLGNALEEQIKTQNSEETAEALTKNAAWHILQLSIPGMPPLVFDRRFRSFVAVLGQVPGLIEKAWTPEKFAADIRTGASIQFPVLTDSFLGFPGARLITIRTDGIHDGRRVIRWDAITNLSGVAKVAAYVMFQQDGGEHKITYRIIPENRKSTLLIPVLFKLSGKSPT